MRRRITQDLLAWKDRRDRRPLLLHGARQVGKTHCLQELGRAYDNVAYVNFETNLAAGSIFDGDIDPARVVRLLEVETRQAIVPGRTLVILDEIQACERALTSLKYFRERAPEYHVAAAGSLLGVALNRSQFSFPVGNVDSLTLYPLDLEEYLWALGDDRLTTEIRTAFAAIEALPTSLHERALDAYRTYLVTGGMPAAVMRYVDTGSLQTIPDVQRQILNDYAADMAKYTTAAEAVRVRAAYESIPVQLAKENRKFQYKLAQSGGTATRLGSAIDWLRLAGAVLKCQKIDHGLLPLAAHVDLASFKLYLDDVGLLTALSALPQSVVLAAGTIDQTFLGALTENYVAQALTANGHPLYYWTSGGQAELDFVLQLGADVVGVEVKTGHRTQSKSLGVFTDRYRPAYSIRISSKNFGFENRIKSVPLYAVFCIDPV